MPQYGTLKDGPTRFPNGINAEAEDSSLAMFPLPNQFKANVFLDDFNKYVAGDWTVTVVDAGVDSADTQSIANADGGILALVNNDADDDSTFLQLTSEIFKMESGKQAWCKARIKISDATQSDLMVGLAITDTTPLDATDGIWFVKVDGSTDLTCKVVKDSTATESSAVATVADDTYVDVAWYYNGVDGVYVFINEVHEATLATTNLPDDEELTPTFGSVNGEAAAKTFSIDYFMAAKER